MRGDSTAFGHDGRVELPPTRLIKSVCVLNDKLVSCGIVSNNDLFCCMPFKIPPICYQHSVSPTVSLPVATLASLVIIHYCYFNL